jgi:Domain of unknown function (DUF2019)
MGQPSLSTMTIDQLVDRFAEIGIAQDNALWNEKYSYFNRLYDRMDEVDKELRSRGHDARSALSRLFTHSNVQVRLQAAKFSLGVEPANAYQVIKSVSESSLFPQAGDAGMTLVNLERGIFKPD